MKQALLALLCCAIAGCYAARSQTIQPVGWQPIEVKVCERAGNYSLPCFLKNPQAISPGDLVVVYGVGGCATGTCDTVFDNLGNHLTLALPVPQYDGIPLWFESAPAGFTGVTFASGSNWWNILAVYPPSTGLDDAAYASYVDAGLTPQGVEIHDNAAWAGIHRPGTSALSPLEAHESCELLIGWALHGQGAPIAGHGFTMRADAYGILALEDSTTTIPDYQQATMHWTYPNAWDMGVAAFKMGGCPQ